MSRSTSRWRFLNPMETLKAIYEALGTPHPKLSLLAVFIICGVLGAGVWWFLGTQVAKNHSPDEAHPPQAPISGTASTSGPKSPAVTGNGNTFEYGNPAPPKKKKPKE